MLKNSLMVLMVLVAGMLNSGCVSRTPEHRFFLLSALPATEQELPTCQAPVQLQAVEVPEYLQRQEMVYRLPSGELKFSSVFWGETLQAGVASVLSQYLGVMQSQRVGSCQKEGGLKVKVVFQELAFDGSSQVKMRGYCLVCCPAKELTARLDFAQTQECRRSLEDVVGAHNLLLRKLAVQLSEFLQQQGPGAAACQR